MLSRKYYRQLQKKKYRRQEKKFLIEGKRFCREALIKQAAIEAAFVSDDFAEDGDWDYFRGVLEERQIPFRILATSTFKTLAATEHPQGIIMAIHLPERNLAEADFDRMHLVLLLDGVRDPGNLGTLIRTADWFGVHAVLLSQDTVDLYNDKVLRSTMGSIFEVPVYADADLPQQITHLQNKGFTVVATVVEGGEALENLPATSKLAIVLGGEAEGISATVHQMADKKTHITGYGKGESLNVAVAGGILMEKAAKKQVGIPDGK